MTWEVARCRVVGNAEPHPKMFKLKSAIKEYLGYLFAKIIQKHLCSVKNSKKCSPIVRRMSWITYICLLSLWKQNIVSEKT